MKFLAFLFVTSLLTFCVSALAVHAAEPAARGARVVASLESRGHRVAVVEHARDDGNLDLVIESPAGGKLRTDHLISALDRDEEDVGSYGVTAKASPNGFRISSVKDWGLSTWSYGYTVALHRGEYVLARFEYQRSSKRKHGSCSLDLAQGAAVVNGRPASFDPPATRLDLVDGIDLERLCERLGMN